MRVLTSMVLAGALATSCGSSDGSADVLRVLAASSLTEAFTQIGETFESSHPGVEVTLVFGASSTLAAQIVEGAPADVFASADSAQMTTVAAEGRLAGDARAFATNELAIIVAPGNPHDVTGVADLARDDLVVVLAAPEVPIGAYTADVLERAGVSVTPESFEQSVKAVVSKVTLGEADAGVVYATDVVAAGDTGEGVAIPEHLHVVVTYPIAVVADSPAPGLAAEFVALVLADEGRAVLAELGFGPP